MRKDRTQHRHWCKWAACKFTRRHPHGQGCTGWSLSSQSLLVGLRGCPTCHQKAWSSHLFPAVFYLSLIISSTFIIIALLLFFKERTMTPIYTQLNTLSILREWLYSSFYKEPVGLKHEKKTYQAHTWQLPWGGPYPARYTGTLQNPSGGESCPYKNPHFPYFLTFI